MPQNLPVSDLVTVSVSVSPAPPQGKSFGVPLILGTSAVLPVYDRVRTYTKLSGGVDADFASNTPEYKAAAAAFGQKLASVKIGRQFTAAQSGTLRGGTASSTLSDYTGITNGGFDIAINGVNKQIFALDFSAAADMAGVASVLQTKLAAAVGSTTCTWDATNKRFIITVAGSTGTGSTIGYAVAPTGGSSPTNQSSFLKLTYNDGAQASAGIAIETVTAAWTASLAVDAGWYGMYICSTTVQDSKDSAAFALANGFVFFDTIADANAEDSTATSDLAYFQKNAGNRRAAMFFDNVNSDKFIGMSALARMLSVDLTQPNSAATLWGKQAPGYAPVSITETQRLALLGKNCNYYGSFSAGGSGFSMFDPGRMADGSAIDEVMNLDWFAGLAQNNVFTELVTTTTKIPQTDDGAGRLVKAIRMACESARTAGVFAPGYWTGPDVGSVKTGDYLPLGYYVFAAPVSSQSASDRAARKSPPLTAIAILAGAIQSAAVGVTIQR
jgi:hypothetical protein